MCNWNKKAQALRGHKIVKVRYMTQAKAKAHGFSNRPVVLWLDNDLAIFPSADDEGNNGGALFTSDQTMPVLPVLR